MENTLALSAFVCAAVAGLAGHLKVRRHLDEHRWLRIAAFAAAFFVIAALTAGG